MADDFLRNAARELARMEREPEESFKMLRQAGRNAFSEKMREGAPRFRVPELSPNENATLGMALMGATTGTHANEALRRSVGESVATVGAMFEYLASHKDDPKAMERMENLQVGSGGPKGASWVVGAETAAIAEALRFAKSGQLDGLGEAQRKAVAEEIACSSVLRQMPKTPLGAFVLGNAAGNAFRSVDPNDPGAAAKRQELMGALGKLDQAYGVSQAAQTADGSFGMTQGATFGMVASRLPVVEIGFAKDVSVFADGPSAAVMGSTAAMEPKAQAPRSRGA